MALELSGTVHIPAPRAVVWAALNTPETLRACIPGCQELEPLSGTELRAVVVGRVGPLKARFRGIVTLSEQIVPDSYRISGEGEGGLAGFARGGAQVRLTETAAGTKLEYTAEAQIGGKIARLGQRLVAGAAKKMADAFFRNVASAVGGEPVHRS
ncbi:carbon monoxide dehydrogenase subunit G [Xanthobacter sp. V4C-4]|uniref:CoxG family protein n=1 Tax=Xanthobacter cornucopiae TaxID=3119924 RepID=UPI00372CC3F5